MYSRMYSSCAIAIRTHVELHSLPSFRFIFMDILILFTFPFNSRGYCEDFKSRCCLWKFNRFMSGLIKEKKIVNFSHSRNCKRLKVHLHIDFIRYLYFKPLSLPILNGIK